MICDWGPSIQFPKFVYTDYDSSPSWQIVDVSEEILRIKQEIDVELHGEDQSWVRNDSTVSPSPSAGAFLLSFKFLSRSQDPVLSNH
jgi:hypothetical protein